MNSSTYTAPGLAAIALAILFPTYWLFAMTDLSMEAIREDFVTLSGWDSLFVVIGALEVFVYLALSRLFRNQLGGSLSAILLIIMASIVAVFHSTILVDLIIASGFAAGATETLVDTGLVISLVTLFLYTVTAFILSIALLTRFSELSVLMRLFAIGLLLCCMLQVTVIFAFVNTFLFPILTLLLAAHFFRGGHSVEVI